MGLPGSPPTPTKVSSESYERDTEVWRTPTHLTNTRPPVDDTGPFSTPVETVWVRLGSRPPHSTGTSTVRETRRTKVRAPGKGDPRDDREGRETEDKRETVVPRFERFRPTQDSQR